MADACCPNKLTWFICLVFTKLTQMLNKLLVKTSGALLIFLILLIPQSCTFSVRNGSTTPDDFGNTLKEIQQRGELVAITDNDPFNYISDFGDLKGYQYEMLKNFTATHGVELKIIVEPNPHKALVYLKQRKADLVAMELPATNEDVNGLVFSEPLFTSSQVLVQRKSVPGKAVIRDLAELKDKSIVLPTGKQKQFYLTDIQHETSYDANITGVDHVSIPDLIEAVALKEADYTIAYEHTAKAMSQIYRNLDIRTTVSPELEVSWIVRKGSANLLNAINTWIDDNKDGREFAGVYSKYYKNPRQARLALGHSTKNQAISDYDDIIRESSRIINWDWRLIAALIYNESKFNSDAVSNRGAFGLMQLMPHTAKRFGADVNSSPAEQISAGLKLIKHLDNAFARSVPDPKERKKFILAAYNIGLAHILDAQKLAEKHGKDPAVWYDNVEFFLLAKSEPQYYNDPVVKFGKVKGTETQRFVRNVLEKYDHYKTLASL